MHENREIFGTPWSNDQGRSAKAITRTAGCYRSASTFTKLYFALN